MRYDELTFIELVGKGNFGEVWRGLYRRLPVAIKLLYFVEDEMMRVYIVREIETLRKIQHPNIVQLVGVCAKGNSLCIVTEYIHGGTLRQKLQRTQLSLRAKIRIALRLAEALDYLHSRDIMHRDLKSDNILIGADGTIKLCDFGLARPETEDDYKMRTNVGTDDWMAPEVLLDNAYGKPADVFSFGMIIWELLTYLRPPRRLAKEGYCFSKERNNLTLLPHTPIFFWDLLCACCETDVDRRPTFAEITQILNSKYKSAFKGGARLSAELNGMNEEDDVDKRVAAIVDNMQSRQHRSLRRHQARQSVGPEVIEKEKEKEKEAEEDLRSESDSEEEQEGDKNKKEKKKGSGRKSKPQTPEASEPDRLRKLLISHIKDTSTSPIEFFGLHKMALNSIKEGEAVTQFPEDEQNPYGEEPMHDDFDTFEDDGQSTNPHHADNNQATTNGKEQKISKRLSWLRQAPFVPMTVAARIKKRGSMDVNLLRQHNEPPKSPSMQKRDTVTHSSPGKSTKNVISPRTMRARRRTVGDLRTLQEEADREEFGVRVSANFSRHKGKLVGTISNKRQLFADYDAQHS